MSFTNDLKVAPRSLSRSKGLALTVILTLSLGIGANSAIFTLVRGVLLKPLVNRDEDRLIYIRQSAPGYPGIRDSLGYQGQPRQTALSPSPCASIIRYSIWP